METQKPEISGIHVKQTSIHDLTALIVDYSEHIRALLNMQLRNEGVKEVFQVGDALSAIEKYRQVRPSVVFVDYILPKMNGLAVVKQLRQIDPQAKIIILTAVSSIEIVKLAKELGASYYLLKPWNAQKLSEILRFVFNLQGDKK